MKFIKILLSQIVSLFLLLTISLHALETVNAAVLGDDYPIAWKSGWVQTLGECTEGNAPHLLLLD